MAGLSMGGPFNGASTGVAGTTTDANKFVYYVPLKRRVMQGIYDFYMRREPLVSRANEICSDQAFGVGYYLEWAERDRIMPDDSYDYTTSVQTLLETARKWRHMFGFVAFIKPNESARDEINRQLENHSLTPEEIAERHIARCTERIMEGFTEAGVNGEKLLGDERNTEAKERRSRRTQEQKRVNIGIPRKPQQRQSNRDMQPEQLERLRKNQLVVRETSQLNGNALTAADSNIEFVQRSFQQLESVTRVQQERRTTLMHMLVSIEDVKIIEVDEGQFYLEIDDLRRTRRIVWVPQWRSSNNVTAAHGGSQQGEQLRFVDYDASVEVFVWPGRMPSREGILNTQFLQLMAVRAGVDEVDDNMRDADYQSSHPTPFIHQSRAPSKTDASSLPEEDMYGIDVIGQNSDSLFDKQKMDPSEIATYKRDVRDALMLEMTVEAQHNKQLQSRLKDISAGHARATRATRGGLGVADIRASMFEKSGIVHLPGGLQLGGAVFPKPVASLGDVRSDYYKQLSIALGIPLSYLMGEQAGRNAQQKTSTQGDSATGTSHSATITEQMVRTTIMRDRDDSARFFDFMYDRIFRAADRLMLDKQLARTFSARSAANEARDALIEKMQENYSIVQQVADLDDNLSSLLSEAARVCQMESEIRRIISLRYRLRLKFVKAPLTDNADVQQMYELGAVSHVDMVNILRQNAGLEKLDEEEVLRIFDQNMRVIQARVEANQPPNAPDSVTETTTEKRVSGGEAQNKTTASGGASKSSAAAKPKAAVEKETTRTETSSKPTDTLRLAEEKKRKRKE